MCLHKYSWIKIGHTRVGPKPDCQNHVLSVSNENRNAPEEILKAEMCATVNVVTMAQLLESLSRCQLGLNDVADLVCKKESFI